MLLAMQMGNLAFTHLTNEVEVVVAYFKFKSKLDGSSRLPFAFGYRKERKGKEEGYFIDGGRSVLH